MFEIPASQLPSSTPGSAKKRKVGRPIKAVILRNESGSTLYGKRVAQLSTTTTTAGTFALLKAVVGYTIVTATENVVIIDEYLSTKGVADDDIFWGILEGPVVVITQGLAGAGNDIAYGNKLVAGSGAATSANSTAGGVAAIATATSQTLPDVQRAIIGTALSARTTAESIQDIQIHAHIRHL